MQKQTPNTFRMPDAPRQIQRFSSELGRLLSLLVRKIRNDLDNGAVTFARDTIDVIANVDNDLSEFDEGQTKLYEDVATSKIYSISRINDKLYRVELTECT